MAEIKRARDGGGEFQGETGEGFVPPDLFKRANVVHDVHEATSQWKLAQDISNSSTAGSEISVGKRKRKSDSSEDEAALKPYECRFCPMKFAKSQALGGHMNRHRQEREREQLLHARQLVLQQGLPWVTGQNHKLQRSADCYNARLPTAPLAPSFQLSQSSFSWNISGLGATVGGAGGHLSMLPETGASMSKSNSAVQPSTCEEDELVTRGASYCSEADMPYMVQQHATTLRASFSSPPNDMLVLPSTSEILEEGTAAGAAYEQNLEAEHHEEKPLPEDHAQQPTIELDGNSTCTDFPSLQLGPGSSEIPSLQQLSADVSPLQMAVDFECPPTQHHPQLLSLGGYNQTVSSFPNDGYNKGVGNLTATSPLAEIMASGPSTVQCDGLSWIFNKGNGTPGVNPVSSPCSFMDGFGLALGSNHGDGEEEADDGVGGVKVANTSQPNPGSDDEAGEEDEDGSGSHLSLLNV